MIRRSCDPVSIACNARAMARLPTTPWQPQQVVDVLGVDIDTTAVVRARSPALEQGARAMLEALYELPRRAVADASLKIKELRRRPPRKLAVSLSRSCTRGVAGGCWCGGGAALFGGGHDLWPGLRRRGAVSVDALS